jgi:uncharacterized coiled-coil protein SlyX
MPEQPPEEAKLTPTVIDLSRIDPGDVSISVGPTNGSKGEKFTDWLNRQFARKGDLDTLGGTLRNVIGDFEGNLIASNRDLSGEIRDVRRELLGQTASITANTSAESKNISTQLIATNNVIERTSRDLEALTKRLLDFEEKTGMSVQRAVRRIQKDVAALRAAASTDLSTSVASLQAAIADQASTTEKKIEGLHDTVSLLEKVVQNLGLDSSTRAEDSQKRLDEFETRSTAERERLRTTLSEFINESAREATDAIQKHADARVDALQNDWDRRVEQVQQDIFSYKSEIKTDINQQRTDFSRIIDERFSRMGADTNALLGGLRVEMANTLSTATNGMTTNLATTSKDVTKSIETMNSRITKAFAAIAIMFVISGLANGKAAIDALQSVFKYLF